MRSNEVRKWLEERTPAERKKSIRFWEKYMWANNPHTKEGNRYLRQQLAKARKN